MSEYITAEMTLLSKFLSERAAVDLGLNLPSDFAFRFLQTYKTNNANTPLELSAVQPDFEQIVRQLHAYLSTKKSWNEIITAGGGQTLLEMIAAVGALLQLSIHRAVQEHDLDTSQAPSSVYSIMSSLGVRLSRKTPASVKIVLTNGTPSVPKTIPAYSQFYINNIPFFNRDIISLPVNTVTVPDVVLYQGVVQTADFKSNGQHYQKFEIGDDDFAISDTDVICRVGAQEEVYTRSETGLWEYGPSDKVFQDHTTQYGNVELRFGNNVFGAFPSSGETIRFIYAITKGKKVNISQSSMPVSSNAFDGVTALTLGPTTVGSDEPTPEFYRTLGPSIFAAKRTAVTQSDMIAAIMQFPGIIDVNVAGQRDTQPNRVSRMNVVQITPLTSLPMTDTQKTAFLKYLDERCVIGMNFLLETPIETTVDVEANIFCYAGANLDAVRTALTNKLRDKMQLRYGSLGYSWYRSDLETILKDTAMNVDYIVMVSPTTDKTVGKSGYLNLGNITLNMNYSTRTAI
jgi:hypothetical protein